MATVALTATRVGRAGASESFTAMDAANTYTVRNNPKTLLHFKKTGAGNANITLVTTQTVNGLAVADATVVVPASTGDVMVACGSLPSLFNSGAGLLSFSTDEDTDLTVAVVELD